MIINITCPDCGKEIKIKVNKVVTLQNRIAVLEKENKTLRDKLKWFTTEDTPDIIKDMFNTFSGGYK